MSNFIGINEAATKKAIKESMKGGGLVLRNRRGRGFCGSRDRAGA